MSARSIKHRINFIQLVKELVADNDWDVFTASETWLNSTVSNTDINIAGYKLIRNDRRHWRGGGEFVRTFQTFIIIIGTWFPTTVGNNSEHDTNILLALCDRGSLVWQNDNHNGRS